MEAVQSEALTIHCEALSGHPLPDLFRLPRSGVTGPKGGRCMSQIDPAMEELIQTDDAFRSLYEEHQESKQRLVAIRMKSLPSQEDEIEVKRIKIHKLSLKDRMELMLHQHTKAHAAV